MHETVDDVAGDLLVCEYKDIRKLFTGVNIPAMTIDQFRRLRAFEGGQRISEVAARGYTLCFWNNKDFNFYCYAFVDGKWENVTVL